MSTGCHSPSGAPRRPRRHCRTASRIPTTSRSPPTAREGTSHGVVTVRGHDRVSVGGSEPTLATSRLQRPGSSVHVSVAEPSPLASATHRSEPRGSAAGTPGSTAASSAAAPSAGAPSAAAASPSAGAASAPSAGGFSGSSAASSAGAAGAEPPTSSVRSWSQAARPVTRRCASCPTQPATSVSRPIAMATGVSPEASTVTVTGSPASSSTPGSATSSWVPSSGVAVATSTSSPRHTVADATPRPMTSRPRALSTAAVSRWSTQDPPGRRRPG